MSALKVHRTLPDVTNPLYQLHFKQLKNGKIYVQRCEECGHLQWPPREFCFQCHQTNLTWSPMNDSGTVYTYTISYRAFHPWFKKHLPYGIVVVDVGKGIRMLGCCFDSDIETLECGERVKAVYNKITEDVTLLEWKRIKK